MLLWAALHREGYVTRWIIEDPKIEAILNRWCPVCTISFFLFVLIGQAHRTGRHSLPGFCGQVITAGCCNIHTARLKKYCLRICILCAHKYKYRIQYCAYPNNTRNKYCVHIYCEPIQVILADCQLSWAPVGRSGVRTAGVLGQSGTQDEELVGHQACPGRNGHSDCHGCSQCSETTLMGWMHCMCSKK